MGGSWYEEHSCVDLTAEQCPPIEEVTAVPGPPSQPNLMVNSSTQIFASWYPPRDDGGSLIQYYILRYWKTSEGTATTIQVYSTSLSVTNLSPSTDYSFVVSAYNVNGTSTESPISNATTLDVGPKLISVVANDPDNGDTVFGNGDHITLTFDMDTNGPSVKSKLDIDTLLLFSSSIGSNYNGSWLDSRTIQILITDASGGSPIIGSTTCSVKSSGQLKNAGETSDNSTSTAVLSGNWGYGQELRGVCCSLSYGPADIPECSVSTTQTECQKMQGMWIPGGQDCFECEPH